MNALVTEHVGLARAISRRRSWYRHHAVRRDDVESYALYGLFRAARKFDSSTGVPFVAFAQMVVEYEIRDSIRTALKLRGRARPSRLLVDREGREYDAPSGADGPCAEAIRQETIHAVRLAVRSLPHRQRDLLESCVLGGESQASFSEKAGVTQGRVAQIKTQAFARLRLALSKYGRTA